MLGAPGEGWSPQSCTCQEVGREEGLWGGGVSKEHLGAEKGQVGACRVARPGGRVPEGLARRSLVSRAAETWRRLACPGPAFGGELPLSRGTGPCRLQWGRTRLSGVSRGWVCLHWVWHLSRFVTQNQTRSWTTFTCCMKARLCWKTNLDRERTAPQPWLRAIHDSQLKCHGPEHKS